MIAPPRLGLVVLVLAGCGDNSAPTDTSGTYRVRIENIAPWPVLKSSTVRVTSDGSTGPAGPGEAFEIAFTGGRGHALSFATMFGESNDWFFAPDGAGIPLHDDAGAPISGDVTRYVRLWNAGTELDQEPAVGDATGPRQPSPDFGGRDLDQTVRLVPSQIVLADGETFEVPAVEDMLRATLRHDGGTAFTLRLDNVSTDQTLITSTGAMAIHLSPLAWALHVLPDPLFVAGTAERRAGVEALAEDGMPDALAVSLAEDSGFATPLSPGLATTEDPLYELGVPDLGEGLERLAEDGDPAALHASRADTVVFDTPLLANGPGPARPGDAFELEVEGTRLHLAAMFGMSNDWLFATPPEGIPLRDGTVANLVIVDLGTELDEELAIGPNTAPQQAAPDTGPGDPIRAVREADYDRPANDHLRVTISSLR